MKTPTTETVRANVRETYGKIAKEGGSCGCGPSCCVPGANDPNGVATSIGYSASELRSAPDGSNLGLGCGNPFVFAGLEAGQTVLDLGSGAGFDAFLAANVVGTHGKVIGVDMTAEMVAKARVNLERSGYKHVEFRLGEIEHLPVADQSIDVIISNCVINLSTDKPAVFREAYRVLKPGGRLAISDIVALKPLPDHIRESMALHVGCIAGTSQVEDLKKFVAAAGFTEVKISVRAESRDYIAQYFPGEGLENFAASATIEAVKAA